MNPFSLRGAGTLVFLLAALGTGGCTGLDVLNSITPRGDYTVATDIPYGDHGMHLDVYTPKGVSQGAPVVVFIYGGSWQTGSTFPKGDYRFEGEALAAKGFVAVIPDYRLYPEARYPDFIDDCAQAVVWTHAQARAYGGDPARLLVMGHSAGAYNAAMLAVDPSRLAQAGGERSWIRAMIGLAGPYDFLPLDDPTLEAIFAPSHPLTASQPITHVDGLEPPMLLLAGDDDSIVYAKNTRHLAAAIRDKGGVAEEHIYPSMSHATIVATTATRLQWRTDVMARVVDFARRYDQPRADH